MTRTEYSSEITQIPTYMVMASCPKCSSRNIRFFSDVPFLTTREELAPEFKEDDHIYIQAQCRECGVFLTLSPALYLIDSEWEYKDGSKGHFHFRTFTVGRVLDGDESARADGEEEPDIRCEWCGAPYHTERGLKLHQLHCDRKPADVRERERIEEERESRGAEWDRTLLEPEDDEEASKVTCPHCGKSFPSQDGLDYHMKRCSVRAKEQWWENQYKKRSPSEKPKKVRAEKSPEPTGPTWYPCDYCGEMFANDDARLKHQKKCDKRPQETERPHRALFLPSSTEVTQDPATVDKSIRYTENADTLVALIQEGGMEVYRKDFDSCPRTDYVDDGKGGTKSVVCGFTQDSDDWLKPPCLKEISFGISDADVLAPMLSPQDEFVICVSECPKCGRRSVLHQFITTMLSVPFVDQRRVMDHIISRGLMDGKAKKPLPTREQLEDRVLAEAERIGIPTEMLKLGQEAARLAAEMEIPKFRIPCMNSKCKAIWTEKNSSPYWATSKYLVASCPVCGSQQPIQDLLKKSARAGTAKPRATSKRQRKSKTPDVIDTGGATDIDDVEEESTESEEVYARRKRSNLSPCSGCGNRAGEECLIGLAPSETLGGRGMYTACEGYGPDDDVANDQKAIRENALAMLEQDNPVTGRPYTIREVAEELKDRGFKASKTRIAKWVREERSKDGQGPKEDTRGLRKRLEKDGD